MRKWLYDNPWIWVVVFLASLITASIATVIIAEVKKPEIVKPKEPRKARGGTSSLRAAVGPGEPGSPGGPPLACIRRDF